jgi:hypothetical protein
MAVLFYKQFLSGTMIFFFQTGLQDKQGFSIKATPKITVQTINNKNSIFPNTPSFHRGL